MRMLLLRGNPRSGGYTNHLTDLFLAGVRETDASVVDVRLPERRIERCVGCYTCWTETPGRCIHDDDTAELLEEFQAADIVVFATPLYYYSMSSAMKGFIERTLPLTKPGFATTPGGLIRNSVRHPDRHPRAMAVIITGAFRSLRNFQPASDTFRLIADGLDMVTAGHLIRPESYLLQFALAKPKTVKIVETAFVQAGREAASLGEISPATAKKASLPIAADFDRFRDYSDIYWEHAVAMGREGHQLDRVQARVGRDVRILMREMVGSLDPKATATVTAVLHFSFPNKALDYRVAVDRGTCDLAEERVESPDLRITCSSEIWGLVFTREIDVRDALRHGKIVLEGDRSLFPRLERFFPPPSV